MTENEFIINNFLVNIFNGILRNEQQQLNKRNIEDLSVVEIHVLEAVFKVNIENNGIATMQDVSSNLGISSGTLTVSSDKLIKKGYLRKTIAKSDKRQKLISLTKKGSNARLIHEHWHEQLTQSFCNELDDEELKVLSKCLKKLEVFFEKENNE